MKIELNFSLTYSLGAEYFQVSFQATNNDRVRASSNILDMQDGSYVVRFRFFQNYKNVFINLTRKSDEHSVANFPFLLKGMNLKSLLNVYSYYINYNIKKIYIFF